MSELGLYLKGEMLSADDSYKQGTMKLRRQIEYFGFAYSALRPSKTLQRKYKAILIPFIAISVLLKAFI